MEDCKNLCSKVHTATTWAFASRPSKGTWVLGHLDLERSEWFSDIDLQGTPRNPAPMERCNGCAARRMQDNLRPGSLVGLHSAPLGATQLVCLSKSLEGGQTMLEKSGKPARCLRDKWEQSIWGFPEMEVLGSWLKSHLLVEDWRPPNETQFYSYPLFSFSMVFLLNHIVYMFLLFYLRASSLFLCSSGCS